MTYKIEDSSTFGTRVETKLKDAFLMLCRGEKKNTSELAMLMMVEHLLAEENLQDKLTPDLWRWCEGNLARVKGQITGAGWVTDAGVEIF